MVGGLLSALPAVASMVKSVGAGVMSVLRSTGVLPPDPKEQAKIQQEIEELTLKRATVMISDLQSARLLAAEEVKGAPAVLRVIAGLIRPGLAALTGVLYALAKFKQFPLNEWDYYLIGGVFAFYFGFRFLEKSRGVANAR